MFVISRVTTSYSVERIGVYKDAKNSVAAMHMFVLYDIHGKRISHIDMDFESMEMDMQVGDAPTITYKL